MQEAAFLYHCFYKSGMVRFIVAVFLFQAVLLAYYREFALLNRTMSGLTNTVVSLMAQVRCAGMCGVFDVWGV